MEQSAVATQRDSNIELLRILLMLMIIAHHFVVHGGSAYIADWSTNQWVSLIILPFGKISFTCFIAISCYFLANSSFKSKRFMKVWLETLFYSVVFAIVAFSFGRDMEPNEWVSIFFPIFGNSHGFAAAYLAFYLLLPILLLITKKLTDDKLLYFTLLIFSYEVISQILGVIFNYTQPFSSEIVLFISIFFIMSYLRRANISFVDNKLVCLFFIFLAWAVALFVTVSYMTGEHSEILPYLAILVSNESSILYIFAGIALFNIFKQIHINYNKIINSLAMCTFGILLIHDHNFFRDVLWHDIICTQDWYHSELFVVYMCAVVVSIFLVCALIDTARRLLLEKPLLKTKTLTHFCNIWDDFINDSHEK